MDSSVSPKDEIWFLRVCHHISNAVYRPTLCHTSEQRRPELHYENWGAFFNDFMPCIIALRFSMRVPRAGSWQHWLVCVQHSCKFLHLTPTCSAAARFFSLLFHSPLFASHSSFFVLFLRLATPVIHYLFLSHHFHIRISFRNMTLCQCVIGSGRFGWT